MTLQGRSLIFIDLSTTCYVRYVDIVSSSLKSLTVLFAKLLRICGCVLSVALLAVGGILFSMRPFNSYFSYHFCGKKNLSLSLYASLSYSVAYSEIFCVGIKKDMP